MDIRKTSLFLLIIYSFLSGNPLKAQIQKQWSVRGDTLVLYDGLTQAFTVDTPADQGSVSTLISEELLQQQIKEAGISMPRYRKVEKKAVPGILRTDRKQYTAHLSQDISVSFTAGQRTPAADIYFRIPKGIDITPDNTVINIIGRGDVLLCHLPLQSIGRHGDQYSCQRVAEYSISVEGEQGVILHLSGVDLRPFNRYDVQLTIKGICLDEKDYTIESWYTTTDPVAMESEKTKARIEGVRRIADFKRLPDQRHTFPEQYQPVTAEFTWTPLPDKPYTELLISTDSAKTWTVLRNLEKEEYLNEMYVNQLVPGQLYAFCLDVKEGPYQGRSNVTWYHAGTVNVKEHGVIGDGHSDDTDRLNMLVSEMSAYGGGVLFFPKGTYSIRTLVLQDNVWLQLSHDAVLQAIPGANPPEQTWFSDKDYRSGLSPTDPKPYREADNYLTKQDVGHTFFQNAMFVGERIENVKIIGNGRITGNGYVVTGDKVMNNEPQKRCDKMFSFKLCKNIEIGGYTGKDDLWYDEQADEPYYLIGDSIDHDVSNMLRIDQGGHFVVLATGCDHLYMHDTYFGKENQKNVRDIYDFMSCNRVQVENIYSRVGSDDIVKLGSDCSLGFTRKGKGYSVRNIIGDTNCNLFQIGSETADDISDVFVDNIYVLGANKAGFSISSNDGGTVSNVFLNSGETGRLHHRSVMKRTRTPFFISISNRGRVLGAQAEMFTFKENGQPRKELLITNIPIGKVDNVSITGVDISEVYGGSSFRSERWKPYDGTQREASAIIAGYKLPDEKQIEGGLPFVLPDSCHIRYVSNISFKDINMTVKGGHPKKEASSNPPELGVGRYNVGDFKTLPAYGYWFRHVDGLMMEDCTLQYEKKDHRYGVVLDDVKNEQLIRLQFPDKNKRRWILQK